MNRLKALLSGKLTLGLTLVTLFVAGGLHVRHHFIDYPVYELAAQKILAGHPEQLYDITRSTPGGFYYSYFFALAFTPFTLAGPLLGKVLFFLLFFVAYLKIVDFSARAALGDRAADGRSYRLVVTMTLLLTAYSANDAFMDANIGILLLVLSILAYERRGSAPGRAGLFLGAAIVFKFYPVGLLGYFVWERNFKVVASTLATVALLYVATPLALNGVEVGRHLITDQLYVVNHFGDHWSFDSLKFQNFPSSAVRFLSLFGVAKEVAFRLAMGLVVVSTFALYLRSFVSPNGSADFRTRMFLFCLALVPLAVPVSWYNMGLFYSPVIAWVTWRALAGKSSTAFVVSCLYTFFYCLLTPDIVGENFNHRIEMFGLPFLGAALLVGYFLFRLVKDYPNSFFFAGNFSSKKNLSQ